MDDWSTKDAFRPARVALCGSRRIDISWSDPHRPRATPPASVRDRGSLMCGMPSSCRRCRVPSVHRQLWPTGPGWDDRRHRQRRSSRQPVRPCRSRMRLLVRGERSANGHRAHPSTFPTTAAERRGDSRLYWRVAHRDVQAVLGSFAQVADQTHRKRRSSLSSTDSGRPGPGRVMHECARGGGQPRGVQMPRTRALLSRIVACLPDRRFRKAAQR